ncbi:MAG: hypothetical protein LUQ48_02010 [Methylococcaceae bacterium]|nr:hypothetical protein [Methylococcaceae bacterium]MDD1635664.1 hypothetical protein [Methylococcaceae bacterium]
MGFGLTQQWSIPEFGVFWHFALIIFPMLSITLADDQICSDRERGTSRFIVLLRVATVRFAGVMVIQALFRKKS